MLLYSAAKEEPFGFFNLTKTNITNTTTALTKAEYDLFTMPDYGGNLY